MRVEETDPFRGVGLCDSRIGQQERGQRGQGFVRLERVQRVETHADREQGAETAIFDQQDGAARIRGQHREGRSAAEVERLPLLCPRHAHLVAGQPGIERARRVGGFHVPRPKRPRGRIAIHQPRQGRHLVLLRGGHDQPVQFAVEERQALAELARKLREAFPAVDQQRVAGGCLDQDGIGSIYIEEGDVQVAVRDG